MPRQVPEGSGGFRKVLEGCGNFRRVPTRAGVGSGGRFRRVPVRAGVGSGGRVRKVPESSEATTLTGACDCLNIGW